MSWDDDHPLAPAADAFAEYLLGIWQLEQAQADTDLHEAEPAASAEEFTPPAGDRSMKIVSKSSGHPVAKSQRLRLVSIDEAEAKAGYNAGARFEFVNVAGEHKGAKAFRTTGMNFSPSSAAGDFVAGFLGQEHLEDGQELDLDEFIGEVFIGDVETSPQGTGTRVARVRPVKSAAKPAKPADDDDVEGDDGIPF